jgi:hypothetical protein
LGKPFVNQGEKIVLNPGDEERYESKIATELNQLIKNGAFVLDGEVLTFLVTDKCLKSELEVEVVLEE